MKPPPFDYLRATSLADVWDALAADDDVKIIAGGQSLIPLLSLRFAAPSTLVDISGLEALKGIDVPGSCLRIGAMTRHAEVESDPTIRASAPLLSRAASWVAHPQIRNRGTLGGSVAHGDAAAEFPAVLLALDATIVAWSRDGERRIPAREFFHSYFTTALEPGELLAAIELPATSSGSSWGFEEFARRKGDYAIGGAAVHVDRDGEGRCTAVRAGLIAAGAGPCLAPALAEVLVDQVVTPDLLDQAVSRSMGLITPSENVHGTAEYRAAVIGEMLRRALASALELEKAA